MMYLSVLQTENSLSIAVVKKCVYLPLILCPWQGVGGGRAKRYSSQRQRPVPEPAPMHIGLMEGHYYEPSAYA